MSGGLFEFVGPCMDNRSFVEVIHGSHDAVLEFLFGCDADVSQDGAGKLGEEALDQVQPGAVRGREGELEAARSGGEPCIRLFGDVGGMIVEDRTARSGVVTIIPAGSSARWDIPGLVNV